MSLRIIVGNWVVKKFGKEVTDAFKIKILDNISIQNSLSKIFSEKNGGKVAYLRATT